MLISPAILLLCAAAAGPRIIPSPWQLNRPDGSSVGMGEIRADPAEKLAHRRKACNKQIAIARKELSAGRWGEARMTLDRAQLLAIDAAQVREIRAVYVQIEGEGRRRMQAAEAYYAAGKYLEAMQAFKVISRTFGHLPSGADARRSLDLIRSDPAAKAAVQEAEAGGLSRLIDRVISGARAAASQPASQPAIAPGRAGRVRTLNLRRQVQVVDLLKKLVKLYGASATGKRAKTDLAKLEGDEQFMAGLAVYRGAERARRAYKRAEAYRKAGLKRKAVQYYRQVVRDFPATPEALQAKAALSVLQISR